MKRKLVLIVLILCLVGASAFAGKENAASLNPIGIVVNTYMGSYERVIFDYLSANVTFAYSPNIAWSSDISLLAVYPGARYYMGPLLRDLLGDSLEGREDLLLPPAPLGPYVGVYLGMSSVFGESFDVGGGAELGFKILLTEDVVSIFAEPYIGVEFLTNDSETNGFKYGVNFGLVF